jgi:hypothetical protein
MRGRHGDQHRGSSGGRVLAIWFYGTKFPCASYIDGPMSLAAPLNRVQEVVAGTVLTVRRPWALHGRAAVTRTKVLEPVTLQDVCLRLLAVLSRRYFAVGSAKIQGAVFRNLGSVLDKSGFRKMGVKRSRARPRG